MKVTWTQIKTFAQAKSIPISWIDLGDKYSTSATDSVFTLECELFKSPSDTTDLDDFEANFKPKNDLYVRPVRTQFENTQYLLQMSHVEVLQIEGGDTAVVDIEVPGTFNGVTYGCNGRYIDGGESWFSPGASGDRVSGIMVVDKNNLLGMGVDTVIGTYHDPEVPEVNQGWALHPNFPLEVETLGWYGFIPSGMTLRFVVKRADGAVPGDFFCNLQWGISQS